jgi:peroxiredoxin
LVDSLQTDIEAFTRNHSDKYLEEYAEIQLAQFRMLSNQYGNDYVVKEYFNPKKIKYQSQAYMTFFNSFWTKYVTSKVPQSIRKRLDSVVNVTQSYQALSALLSEDSLLQDPALRELVILRNLPQMYRMKRFDKKAIINILYDISASKYNKENQQIAVNLRKKLQALDVGNRAPDFEFYDSNSDTLNLQTLAGKYIYIQVWDDKCVSCLAQMKYTKELYEKFNDIITFISISLDRSPEDMMRAIGNKDYDWHFVFLNDNYHFLQDYQVSVLPHAILIDTEGNFISWDARLPTDYFEDFFLKMINDKKGNLDVKTRMRNGSR